MLINLPRFRRHFPRMLAFGQRYNFSFPAFDQGWLNAFFTAHAALADARVMMDARWNWKVYWGEPRTGHPYIVHFHGPKPGRGAFLTCLASMNRSCLHDLPPSHPYMPLLEKGFKADGGRFAKHALLAYQRFTESCDEWLQDAVS